MKAKLVNLLLTIIVMCSFILSGCGGDSKPKRPSVLTSTVAYVSTSDIINNNLRNNEEKTRKDLNGKVVEIIGPVADIGTYNNTKGKFITFKWLTSSSSIPPCTVRADILNPNSKNFEAVRKGDIAIIRGYADVFYSKQDHNVILYLDDAEVIDTFNNLNISRISNKVLAEYAKDYEKIKFYK